MMIKDKTQKGTLPAAELDILLKFIKTHYWKDSFRNLKLPVLSSKEDWFVNTRRADYYTTVSTIKRESVLDIGTGAGVISEALSGSFKKVYSLEYSSEWVEFMSMRFRQEGIRNIRIIKGNAVELPFKANKFDLAVVNGVLEWVADFSPEGCPREIQLNFLKDIFRVLKTGGRIGIAIENRAYLRCFLGESPHGEPPFVVLMPRFLANYVCNKKLHKEYRNYIYSYWGYKKLLKEAGFNNIDIKLAVPNYYNPLFIVNFDKKSHQELAGNLSTLATQNFILKRLVNLLLHLGLLGYFEHSFYISGEKQ